MKPRRRARAIVGVLLCLAGFVLARGMRYRETTVIVDAGGCRMVTDIVDSGSDATQGSVVLLHGLAANKKIMSYLAYGFAQQNLRVFVPDLPGHGRTQGPFSFVRAETCVDSLVHELIARGAIDPARTILAGHSMGGAIAVRVGSRVPVAGVIAVSPAPMRPAHRIPAEIVLFARPPVVPANTLVISGLWEPSMIRDAARDLLGGDAVTTGKYVLLPGATHVGLLFDRRVARVAQEWAAGALRLASDAPGPSSQVLVGSLAGLAGLLFLAGPFIRETLGMNSPRTDRWPESAEKPASGSESSSNRGTRSATLRLLLETALASLFGVIVLRFWNPLSFLRIFNGDYLAGFLLVTGFALLLLHRNSARMLWRHQNLGVLLAAAAAGMTLYLLVMGWLDVTLTETWPSAARWARFPVLLLAALVYLASEELLLRRDFARGPTRRLVLALAARLVLWMAMLIGIFTLHSGAILLLLLAPYWAVFCLLHRLGMDVVRKDTGSTMAAALFGAILLAGFFLVIFPVT
jgi:pimeloyl-ACP methyl ester carboxylesterase